MGGKVFLGYIGNLFQGRVCRENKDKKSKIRFEMGRGKSLNRTTRFIPCIDSSALKLVDADTCIKSV